MADYLATYGAGEEERNTLIKRSVLGLLLALILFGAGYFLLRDYREKSQLRTFLENLKSHNYTEAYRQWGCAQGPQNPCGSYTYDKFMEDWGPGSTHADANAAKVESTKSCDAGIIQKVTFPKDQVLLWVARKDKNIGFAPWPVCNPHIKMGGS